MESIALRVADMMPVSSEGGSGSVSDFEGALRSINFGDLRAAASPYHSIEAA